MNLYWRAAGPGWEVVITRVAPPDDIDSVEVRYSFCDSVLQFSGRAFLYRADFERLGQLRELHCGQLVEVVAVEEDFRVWIESDNAGQVMVTIKAEEDWHHAQVSVFAEGSCLKDWVLAEEL